MNTRAKKPQREDFLINLKQRLKEDADLRAAWLTAKREGCTELNLVTFLYSYSVGEELVIGPRRESRKRVLTRLAALAQRLEGDAADAEQLLNFRWWKKETVLELLTGSQIELEFEKAQAIRNGIPSATVFGPVRVKGRLRPDFILALPNTLRLASQGLNWIRRGLGKEKGWNERAVGRTIYLASLVLYWQAVSGKMPAWKYIAALVEGARIAAGSCGRHLTETALRLNFESFRKRNPAVSSDLASSLAEYLRTKDPGVSFYTWDRQRKQTA